jgi:hypothetical protein
MEREKASPSPWSCRAQSCLLALLTASTALGQITPASGPEIQVATSSTFQASPAVASDAAGHLYVVVWQKQVAGGWDVYARQYSSAAGGVLTAGPELQVNTVTVGCQQFPAVAADGAGNFVVVWQSDQDPGGGSGIYARRYASAATPIDAVEFRVNTTVVGNQSRPSVAMAPDGRFLIAWQSDSQSGGQGWDIAAQAYTSTGTPAAGEILVNATPTGAQCSPRAAYLAGPVQGFAVVWESAGGIFLRRLTPSGAPFDTTDQPVNTTTSGIQRNPTIASDPSGNYVVAFEHVDADSLTSSVLARRFQGVIPLNGMADLTVDASPGASDQHEPALASSGIADWVVTWSSLGEDGSGAAVVAQEFDNRQVPKGSKVVLDNTLTAGDQTAPAVAMSQGGGLLAAWQSLTPAADGAVVEARAGALVAGSFFTVTPCRLLDTRNANGSLGGPVLASGAVRVFPVVAQSGCGIPTTAKALSVNVTAVSATGGGFITVYPGDAPLPGTSTVSFSLSRPTIASNAHVTLSRDGAGTVAAYASVAGSPGQVHLIIDVNGYYQ